MHCEQASHVSSHHCPCCELSCSSHKPCRENNHHDSCMNDQISYRWVQPSNSVLACVHSLVSLVYLVPPIVLPSIPIHTRMMYTLIIIHYWKQICDQSVLIWLDQSTEDREWASPFCVESTAQGQTVERDRKWGRWPFGFVFIFIPQNWRRKISRHFSSKIK